MSARDDVSATTNRLIELAVNLAQSPHGKDLEDWSFRDYHFNSREGAGLWNKLHEDLYSVYLEERRAGRGQTGSE